jgi:hypothetical protein
MASSCYIVVHTMFCIATFLQKITQTMTLEAQERPAPRVTRTGLWGWLTPRSDMVFGIYISWTGGWGFFSNASTPSTEFSGLRLVYFTAPHASSKQTLSQISGGQWIRQQGESTWRLLKHHLVDRALCVLDCGPERRAFAWSRLCWTKVELFLERRINCHPLHTPDCF